MADQPNLQVQPGSTIQLPSQAGVRRDGTTTDSDYFNDTKWCRFVRNRPRKIGGFQEISNDLAGPVHGGLLFSRQYANLLYAFSKHGVEYGTVTPAGPGSLMTDITPAAYSYNENTLWQYTTLYDSAFGSTATLLVASPVRTLTNIDDPYDASVYTTPSSNPGAMTAVTDAAATMSGSLFATAPYVVLLGNDGKVTWSDANQPKTYSSGDAGTARVTGTKLVKGLPMRTGVSSGGLLWSLDSVLRMDWIGGTNIFKFSHISTESSVLSQRSIIEVDGKWYWIGVNRFLVTNGIQIDELPNDMNLNWFFDNLNFAQRQKVFAMRVPRFGEIWWHFPFGDSTECNKAIIYNTRLKTWYDVDLSRSAGFSSASSPNPVMFGSMQNDMFRLTLTVSSGSFVAGANIKGVTGGFLANVVSVSGSGPYVVKARLLSTALPTESESYVGIDGTTVSGSVTSVVKLSSAYLHEKGFDAVSLTTVTAIESYFETCDFGMPTGGFQNNPQQGQDINTRITRVEPDFKMSGSMDLVINTKQFAQSTVMPSDLYTFDANTDKIDIREQAREFRMKFSSNKLGGFYEGGKTLVHLEPGDPRP